jgi:hypothetical protein
MNWCNNFLCKTIGELFILQVTKNTTLNVYKTWFISQFFQNWIITVLIYVIEESWKQLHATNFSVYLLGAVYRCWLQAN